MIIPILVALGVVVILLVVVASLQPSEFRVTRSATISAPAAVVFAQVNDLHKWETWSPWEKLDPALKRTFAGQPAGTGASYSWAGNNKVGAGSMTIADSRAGELIRMKLEFLKPFKATNTAEFAFKSDGNQTVVTWSMTGKKVFVTKIIGLFVSMDKMIGGNFEKGLAQMKSVSEATTGK